MPRISATVTLEDRAGAWKVRWGMGRMRFIVPPGLYAIGSPGSDDPVVVTANYKMSYDSVRKALAGRNAWLLVLETYGVNVWCAAGKGTFGTGEVVRRIAATGLADIVSHRRLILPLLGAAGVSAHQVLARSGFSVDYAAIRASDLPAYLDNGMTATPAMRRLSFSFYERLVLIPVELVLSMKVAFPVAILLYIAALLATGSIRTAALAFAAYAGAVLSGIVAGPLLLPWLPGRSFAVKGAAAGFVWSLLFWQAAGGTALPLPITAAVFLGLPAVSSFYTLNFTGSSPYTSHSGVRKEMRLGLPAMAAALLLSLLLVIIGQYV